MANLLSNTTIGGYQSIHTGNIGSYALTSLPSHNHDDRYYTETESDGRYAYKAGAAGQDFSVDKLSSYYLRNNYSVSANHSYGMYFDNDLSSAYGIYRESGAWDHPYPDLRIAFHTGIKLGANSSYQGIKFYTDYDMVTQVMSVNNGSDPLGAGNVYVNNSLQAGSSLRAPIFYDTADTGYYGDFASTSVMNSIRFGTSTNNGTLSGAGDWGMRFTTDSGYITFGPANGSYAHIYTDRGTFYFNKDLLVNGNTVWHAGNDGSGSGLDADLLDGQDQSYYFSTANMNASRNIGASTNLDTDLENGGSYGSYGAGGTSWNSPFAYGGVMAYAFTSGIKAQFGFDIRHNSSDYGNLWYRTKNNLGYSTWRTMWHSGNLTNLNQLTNGPGYITGYTETDTLASVTARGATTGTLITLTKSDVALKVQEDGTGTAWRGRLGTFNATADKSAFLGNYLSRAGVFGHNNALTAWDDLWVNTLGIHGQGNLYLSWNTYVKGSSNDTNYGIWHAGNLTNLNQLTNGPGYITGYTETDTLNSVTGRGNTTGNNLITSANVYASIFYDYNDNGYYVNPNSTSVLYYLQLNAAESMNLYGIRGRFTNEYIHLYNKVGVGHPGGWGQGEGSTPNYGFSTYGGANFAYGNGALSTFNGQVNITGSSMYVTASQLHIGKQSSGTAQISFESWGSYTGALAMNASGQFHWGGQGATSWYFKNNCTYDGNYASSGSAVAIIGTDGNLWMSWANDWLSNLLAAKQNASTAITTSNIGSQSVSYATTAGALSSMNISQFSNNSGYLTSLPSHNHDDRYYTEAEINSQIGDRLYQARINGFDVNAFNATGLYRGSTSGWSNRPTIAHNGGALLTIDTHPSDYHSQLFFDTGADRLYFRNANAGSWGSWLIMFHTGNYTSYVPTLTGTGASGTWSINVTGSAGSASTAGSATNLSGTGGSSIQSTSTGTSYTANYQVRENAGGGGNTNEIYAPQLAFHWGGVVASSIMMESSGRMAIRNNPGGSYENFIAAVIYSSGYGDSTQWNTAFGWGNHASAGYLTSLPSHNHDDRYYTETESDSRYLYYRGYSTSGNTQNFQSTANTIRFDQVGALDNGAWSNQPTGYYTYGGILSLRGASFGLQIYGSHTGDLAFKTQWDNDQYSGWRTIISSANIGSQSVSYASTAGSAPANGGNSSTVGGYSVSVGASANTIPTRNSSGYLIPESWIQLNGTYGLYSPTNNAHLRPNSGSYGSWQMTGSRNGWQGIEFDSGSAGNISLMVAADSNTVGFHNNNYGWQFRWNGGTLYVYKNAYGAGTEATVLDSSNYSSWAQPIASAINTGNIGSQSVSYATTAGTANAVAWGNVSSKPSLLMYYQGFTLDANTMDGNSTGFTYSVNAPFTGPIARFSETGYSLQLNAAYSGSGTGIAFRTRNGDAGSFNPWRVLLNDANYTAYSPSLTGSGASGTWSINVTGGAGSAGSVPASGITGQTGMWTSSNRPGAYRLYRNDDDSAYNVQTTWSADKASHWSLRGYYNDSYHGPCYVASSGFADNAGQLNNVGYLVGDNWNTYYTSGKLRVASVAGSTSTGAPPNVHNYGGLLSYGISGEDVFQMYFPDNAGNSIANSRKLTYRTGRTVNANPTNNGWCDWRTVVDMVGDTLTIVEGSTPKIIIRGGAGYGSPTSASIELVGDADNNQTKSYRWISTAPDWNGQDLRLERYSINGGYQLVGRVPKNTSNLEWQGTIVQGLSDSRVKTNVVSMTEGLDKIDRIRPVTFDWVPTENVSDREGADFGFIAQELEEVLPEVVHTRGDGYKTVMYEKVVPVLVQAMKEQQKMIEALRAEIDLLKTK